MANQADLTKVTFSAKGIALLAGALFLIAVLLAIVTPVGQAVGGKIVGTAQRVKTGVTQESKQAKNASDDPTAGMI